jgi:hypothetical protein
MSAEVLSKLREKLLSESGLEVVEVGEVRERDWLPRMYEIEMMPYLGEDLIENYYPKLEKHSWTPGFGAPCKRGRKKR